MSHQEKVKVQRLVFLLFHGFIYFSLHLNVHNVQAVFPRGAVNVFEKEMEYDNMTYGDRMVSSSAPSLVLHPNDCNGLCVSAQVCLRHGGTAKGMCSKNGGVFCCFATSCNQVSKKLISYFHNPGYPAPAIGTMICQHDVIVREGICAIRLEFEDFNTTQPLDRGICDIDQFLILNSLDGAAFPRCGDLSGYTTIVSVENAKEKIPLTLLSIIQSRKMSFKWRIKVSQLKCQKRRILDHPNCAKKSVKGMDMMKDFQGRFLHTEDFMTNTERVGMSSPHNLDVSSPYLDNFFYLEYLRQSHDMMMDMTDATSKSSSNKTLCKNSAMDMKGKSMPKNIMIGQMTFSKRIIRGEDTHLFQVPWQVSIQNRKGHFCGGALVSEHFVITAAHCFMSIAPKALSKLKVVLGDHNLNVKTETNHIQGPIQSVIFHSHFDPYYLRNDIAVIKLRQPVQFRPGIQPVCLGEAGNEYVGSKATISGWGATTYPRGKLASTLQQVENDIINNTDCKKLLKIHYLFPTMICAVSPRCAGTCFGDSGGPLVAVSGKNKVSRLVGIVSFGIGGCAILPYWPDVYTRVTAYLDWISYATTWVEW